MNEEWYSKMRLHTTCHVPTVRINVSKYSARKSKETLSEHWASQSHTY